MQFTSTLIAVFAVCAQVVSSSAIVARDPIEERLSPYSIVCPPSCSQPKTDDCAAMAAGLVAQGNTPLYMGAGTNLEYNQGSCRMVFYITANDTITYSKLDIAENIKAIRTQCFGGNGVTSGAAVSRDGRWYQTLTHSL